MHPIVQVNRGMEDLYCVTEHVHLLRSYNRIVSLKEELEQKYLHLSQVYESEAKTKYQYLQQVEELSTEVRELRGEVSARIIVRSKTFSSSRL
jgi:phage terminase large subunit-like protein